MKQNKIFKTITLLLVSTLIIMFLIISVKDKKIHANNKLTSTIIYIDPGHGGFDGGACSNILINNQKVIEKDITLQVSLYLQNYLEKTGFKVLITRNIDKSLGTTKKEDIYKRVDLINNSNADIYLSIHANSYPHEIVHGAQTFYNSQNEENKNIAISIMDMLKNIDKTNNRMPKSIENKYLLDHVKKIGCLIEIGFLTNNEELRKLISDNYQQQLAFMIYLGILNYLESRK